MRNAPVAGEFVEARGRLWLVEEAPDAGSGSKGHLLACVDDDAQGETARVLWAAEIGARSRDEEGWTSVGGRGADAPETFSAYLRTLAWNSATAADRDLFQAPFRAGIRLDAYQLLPLRKALRLPRVNLLIADDVGLGKTVEAGLVMRELLLRRRIDFIVVAAPPSMTIQWQDELADKFGLAFEIVDRDHLAAIRRARGFGVNPWGTGSRFIVSHKLLTDETYMGGLRELLTPFRPRTLLIVDEAHHAAPSGGGSYAIESQFTKALRGLAGLFEHRLFLSATPHNGHPNSFATLLEILDPQRFTRGMDVRPADLEAVMVRRLKSDLRALGEAFPERRIQKITLDALPDAQPELRLAAMLADYGHLRDRRIGALTPGKAAQARLAFIGLQQRLLSSVPAFARTVRVHRASLQRLIDGTASPAHCVGAEAFTAAGVVEDEAADAPGEAATLDMLVRDEDSAADAATRAGAVDAGGDELRDELAAVDAMLVLAEASRTLADARIVWLRAWITANQITANQIAADQIDGHGWTNRRLIVFTEYEDTRRYLERQLGVIAPDEPYRQERIASFTGVTSTDRREALKRAFNDARSPLRILICTDAAREGINLQAQCHDLVHFDLPWNPSRLEQRNGRIDRKLQPAPVVTCRYFVYAQRPEDMVLDALVRKTETIRAQLGAAGQVLEDRIAKAMASGIDRADAAAFAARIQDEADDARVAAAIRDLQDAPDRRLERLRRETEDLKAALERARKRVGVDAGELREVVGLAVGRAGTDLAGRGTVPVNGTPTFTLSPDDPAFAQDQSWQALFDELRPRGPRPGERQAEWRAAPDAAVRRISFAPAIDAAGRDAAGVLQVHLEHRLVRRLLSRFMSAGFQSDLGRMCAIVADVTAPRAILIGRVALYGAGASRLHEELIPVTAEWRDRDRESRPLRPFASDGAADARTVAELQTALRSAVAAPGDVLARVAGWVQRDIADLRSTLVERAVARRADVARVLEQRGREEADGLTQLLTQQIARIHAEQRRDDRQFALGFDEAQVRQRDADRRSWEGKLTRLDDELIGEPARLLASYDVRATRIEPIGMVYLWPEDA